MRTATHSILIEAEPRMVWEILLKVHEYDNWNPVYKYMEGIPSLGATVTLEMKPDMEVIGELMDERGQMLKEAGPAMNSSKLKCKVLRMDEASELEWEAKILWGLFLTSAQSFELQSAGTGKTMFTNTQRLSGFLINLMPKPLADTYFPALSQAFNMALKAYVESQKEEEFI